MNNCFGMILAHDPDDPGRLSWCSLRLLCAVVALSSHHHTEADLPAATAAEAFYRRQIPSNLVKITVDGIQLMSVPTARNAGRNMYRSYLELVLQ